MRKGRYGDFGGQYIGETLMAPIQELEAAFEKYKDDAEFNAEFMSYLNNYAGRPSLLYYAENMTKDIGGAKIYLKREDLNHTGSHKINNVIGQCLIAKHMGKKRIIAETGAGQHGVASATAAALFGLECTVYMGVEDMRRQSLNVFRMELLGAEVKGVSSGTGTLKDACNEALRVWASEADRTFYVFGTAAGPHPYPEMVKYFQSVISKEAKKQIMEAEGRLPDAVMACVGGGSNAIGMFADFIDEPSVKLYGAEAAGDGIDTERHAATISKGKVGVLHGMKSLMLQDDTGNIMPVYSISAGLDYPGIGPEHAMLAETGRAEYFPVTDKEAVDAFEYLSKTEGIIPAIESAHAVALARKTAKNMSKEQILIICISGRGDKDVYSIAKYMGRDIMEI